MLLKTLALTIAFINVAVGAQVNKSVFSGESFYYYDQEDRVQILKDFYHSFKSNYSLWDFKKRRIGVDGDKLLQEAIEFEFQLKDTVGEFAQAKANLDFLDRAKKLGAAFQDTHFALNPVHYRPVIFNGIRLKLSGKEKKVVVASIFKKIIARNQAKSDYSPYDKLALFDEVLEIDGVKISKQVKEMSLYIDGSSKYFREMLGAESLTIRRHKYPMKNYSDFTFRKSATGEIYKLRLPWYYSDRFTRRDSSVYFSKVGFLEALDVRFAWDKFKKTWVSDRSLSTVGYFTNDAPVGLIGKQEWNSSAEGGSLSIRTGYTINKGKVYGLLQMYTFGIENVFKDGQKNNFLDVARFFIKDLKEQEVPLILDFRVNGGGSSNRARAILSMVAKSGEVYPERTTAFKMTRKTRLFIQRWDGEREEFKDIGPKMWWDHYIDNMYTALRNKEHYSNVFANGMGISADPKIGGFELPVVMLLSPRCVSACDNMAMLFKASKRGEIIGSHSNGTGAGFRSNSEISADWRDSYDILTGRIPNYLFGFAAPVGQIIINEEDAAYKYNSENRPTTATIEYYSTMQDYVEHSSGWLQKAFEVLN